jgi:hypothetical protein
MSSVVISGDTSGAITLAAPAVAGTNTITLPASTGTVITTGSPQSGGVIQVVNGTYSGPYFSTTSTTFVSTGLTVTITPKFATSKILILLQVEVYNDTANKGGDLTIYRNGSNLASGLLGRMYPIVGQVAINIPINYYDSPATTSATTYTLYIKTTNAGYAFNAFQDAYPATITALEVAA